MALNDVKDKIIEEAQHRAQQSVREADEEAKKLHDGVQCELLDYEERLKANADRMIEAAERREIAAAEFEGKRLLLDKRREIIIDVVKSAEKHLQTMSDAERSKLLAKLLKQAQSEIAVKRIMVSAKDIALVQKMNVASMSIGAVKSDLKGGLIAENEDGTIRVDYSFDSMLSNIAQHYLRELNEVLFQ